MYVVEHAPRLVETSKGLVDQRRATLLDEQAATAALVEATMLFEKYHLRALSREIEVYGEDIATALSRAAAEYKADLVVMGTHGRRCVRRFLEGSVAESFLGISEVPVLLVRQR